MKTPLILLFCALFSALVLIPPKKDYPSAGVLKQDEMIVLQENNLDGIISRIEQGVKIDSMAIKKITHEQSKKN